MRTKHLLAASFSLLVSGLSLLQAQTGEEATLYRDEFGIPHIYAPSLETAAFAAGYAQAEDRLEELLKNYRRANGTMAEVFGPSYYQNDLLQRIFRHEEISREKYGLIDPKIRAVIESYQRGIRQFMKEHPEQVPSWAQEIHPWDVLALGRFIIWGWPLGEAGADLQRAGIKPDEMAYRGSNEILLGPGRTAMKAPIAIIDPHLSWYGEFRFYQVRIYAGDFNVSGVSLLGSPLPSLGHSRYCSIAMTTGGPDTSDIFEEELNPANPRQYRYDGQWRDLQVRKTRIGVKNGDKVDWKEVELESSHHGPIIAHKNGKAYAVAIPYAEEVGLTDQTYETLAARNLGEMKQALSHLQLMAQNVMVATVQGDIYYVRNGRVPVRAPGADPSRPIPGSSSTNEWRGLHPFTDLVQLENPAQGYMHNNNVTPFGMMKDSPLTPEKYAKYPYLYNATREAPRHQRAEMMTELLDAAHDVTAEQAIGLAFNCQVYQADKWQARLKEAWTKAPETNREKDAAELYNLIQEWNRRSEASSEGALAFYAFKKGFEKKVASAVTPPPNLSDKEILAALDQAAQWLKENFGTLRVPYGKYFRVGREGGERTYPVGGGSVSEAGMATVRAISYNKVGNEMVGRGGQTSTQIVILTDPPESYTIVPLGVSDHKESGHWDDQAEKLFSKAKAAPTYFMNRQELLKHVTATRVLKVLRGKVIVSRTDSAWESQQVQEPCILPNPKDPARLVMFYSGVPATNRSLCFIGKAWALKTDPFNWRQDERNPVFGPGKDGWDSGSIRLDTVIYIPEEDSYYVYYSGTTGSVQDRIGLAICPAGRDGYSGILPAAFQRVGTQPVLAPEPGAPFYEQMTSQAAVWREWDTKKLSWEWFMYYSYRGKDGILPGLRLATSPDGKTWTRHFNEKDPRGMGQIFKSTPGAYYEWHQIFKIGGTYVLSMEVGVAAGQRWRPVMAVSQHPATGWEQLGVDTLLQTRWNGLYRDDALYHVATPAFYPIEGQWYLFAQACPRPENGNYIDGRWDLWGISCERLVPPPPGLESIFR